MFRSHTLHFALSRRERGKGMQKSAARLVLMALAMVLAGGVLLAGAQGRAQALASHPPDATLRQGGAILQEGRLISYCWSGRCVDGVSNYPSAVLVDPGTRLRIRLSENRRPEEFSLTRSWSRDGQGRRIDTTLRRVVRDGKTVAWDAYFRVYRSDRHYYLDAFGAWKNQSGTVRGDAYWQLHVKTRS